MAASRKALPAGTLGGYGLVRYMLSLHTLRIPRHCLFFAGATKISRAGIASVLHFQNLSANLVDISGFIGQFRRGRHVSVRSGSGM